MWLWGLCGRGACTSGNLVFVFRRSWRCVVVYQDWRYDLLVDCVHLWWVVYCMFVVVIGTIARDGCSCWCPLTFTEAAVVSAETGCEMGGLDVAGRSLLLWTLVLS